MYKEYKCERCGAAPEKKGYDEGIDQESAAALRITEVQTNFGVVWAMCIDCRREWVKWLNNNKLMQEYSRTGFRLDHWRIAHRKTGKADVEEGLKLIDKLNELDAALYNQSTEWFEKGKAPEKPTKLRAARDDNDEYENRGFGGSDD
jgi:hypothetical protein